MIRLASYLCDTWHEGQGALRPLVDPSTEAELAATATEGLDLGAALAHARQQGGPALRAMSFQQRGELIKAMSRALHAHREELLDLSMANNGATRGDAKFDVDGAIGTLAYYASLGKAMGEARLQVEGEGEKLGQGARFVGQHVRLPRPGVAVHINAFNFPAWGTFEKVAVSLLAGVPVLTKPATATALVAFRAAQVIAQEVALPPGVFSFLAGPVGDLLDHLGPQDMIAFTGSADTGATLRAHPAVLRRGARLNIEADSLNAALLGPDVGVGDDIWAAFVRNIVQDMTQKTGQKCTAIRRILVPRDRLDDLAEALVAELARITVGDPRVDGVRMGPVATAAQLRDVLAGVQRLRAHARLLCGGERVAGQGAPEGKGFFVAPTLLCADDAFAASEVHQHEVFGPCATLLPYDGGAEQAAALLALGQGSLVSSVYGDDKDWLSAVLLGAASWNGRVQVISAKVADQATPPGMVLPSCVHGGPGRAGGGEELGGPRGMDFYTQRVAVQGDRGLLGRLFGAEG